MSTRKKVAVTSSKYHSPLCRRLLACDEHKKNAQCAVTAFFVLLKIPFRTSWRHVTVRTYEEGDLIYPALLSFFSFETGGVSSVFENGDKPSTLYNYSR